MEFPFGPFAAVTMNILASPAMLLCADLLALNLSQLFQFAHIFKILSIHPFCPPQANRGYGSVLD
jgi:hypothetical protein